MVCCSCCLPVADEPSSPKKAKSSELERWLPPPSPEWAIVRVIPEEEMAEHNLLAVRVMVTSDASSSELDSDLSGDSSSSEPSEGLPSPPEPRAHPELGPAPIQSWAPLIRSPERPKESSRTSKVADALQRANSFQSTALNKYQNWRRKIQTSLPLLSSRKPGPHGKESSAVCQGTAAEEHRQAQLASYKKPPEIPRGHSEPCSSAFQRKEEAREVAEDTDCYVPHCPVQSSSTAPPQSPLGNGTLAAAFCEPENTDRDTGTRSAQDWKEKAQKFTSEPEHFSGKTEALSPLDLKEQDGKNTRQPEEKLEQELKEAKEGLGPGTQQQAWYGSPRAHPDGAAAAPAADTKDALRVPDVVSREHVASQPKSPLRLIANAIKRSIWEPLTSAPEGLKQDSDSKAKASSEQAFFSFPSTSGYSLRQRNRNNNNTQSQDPKVREGAGKEGGDGSPYSSQPHSPVGSEETALRDYRGGVFFTPYRPAPHVPLKAACTRMEEVPGLLEKFTFEDSPVGAPLDEICIRKKKATLLSSPEPKNSFKDTLDDSAQKGSLFNRLRSKTRERERNSMVSSLPLNKDHSPERSCYPFTGEEHLPVRKQATEYPTSSSDEDLESKSLLMHKAERALRKRRRLEKETKQLMKQEELKRLHKAQAVQRQLEELEERQRALEIFGVELERELRGEADSGTKDENQMLHEWFELVMEKNKLMRYESELLIIAQELELEDQQSRLEQQLREKMAIDDSLKDELDLNEEDEIFTEMMKVVEERDRLVCALEEQRVKERAEDQHLESFILSTGYQLSRI
ncbi:F-actin-monooxygenase MICAL2-like [Poecile atricapillus]|uniref:F-actin-monooxygenase MICAL2-like n=1 Tax=Poecile atricapillus TaxID=48891 RepID=UPI002738E4B1|nr:F-actin-monooxygenase MICAL2-like [Poecile atricapillus]